MRCTPGRLLRAAILGTYLGGAVWSYGHLKIRHCARHPEPQRWTQLDRFAHVCMAIGWFVALPVEYLASIDVEATW